MKDVMTVEQAAEYLQVSRRTLDKLINDKIIPALDISHGSKRKCWRISKTELDKYLSGGGKSDKTVNCQSNLEISTEQTPEGN